MRLGQEKRAIKMKKRCDEGWKNWMIKRKIK